MRSGLNNFVYNVVFHFRVFQPIFCISFRFTKIFSFYALHWVKDQDMVLKNTNQLLSNGGEALFAAVYDSPYFNIYDKISKEEKWGKYMHDVENLLPKFATWPNVAGTYAKKVELFKNELRTEFQILHIFPILDNDTQTFHL